MDPFSVNFDPRWAKRLADGSTAGMPTCWETPFVRIKRPTRVKKGDRVELRIQSDLSGTPTYSLQMTQRTDGSSKPNGA
jgi:hypothetical protein